MYQSTSIEPFALVSALKKLINVLLKKAPKSISKSSQLENGKGGSDDGHVYP